MRALAFKSKTRFFGFSVGEQAMKMRRLGIVAAAGVSIGGSFLGSSAQAAAPTPAGLNPGDHFYLVFVTDGTTPAASTDISTYDAIVSAEAASAGLNTYNGSPVTWQTLGSTEGGSTVAASRFSPTASIYRLDGARIATGAADLYDSSIENAINLTPTNATLSGNSIWTGSNADGTEAKGLGGDGGSTTFGLLATDSTWLNSNTATSTDPHNLYAFSNQLTVAPEPASAGLLALGAVVTTMRRGARRGARRR
jgi:hypothetical protein